MYEAKAGETHEGIAKCTEKPGVPAGTIKGKDGTAYTLEPVNECAKEAEDASVTGDKAKAKATETDR